MSNVVRVGVVGYVSERFDTVEAWKLVQKGFETVRRNFPGKTFEVVSTMQDRGVPQAAYYQAAQNGWATVGVAPAEVLNEKTWPTDTAKCAGEKWGDEQNAFLEAVDVVVSVGRNNFSLATVKEAKKRGLSVHEYKLDDESVVETAVETASV